MLTRRIFVLFGFSMFAVSCLAEEKKVVTSSAEVDITTSRVQVTGKPLAINGVTKIPLGLFGVHATPVDAKRQEEWGIESVRTIAYTPKDLLSGRRENIPESIEKIIECFGDRYQPALILTNPNNWQQILTELGYNYGISALNTGKTHYIEFWNEPYLNWATLPGVNYDGRFYDQSNAAIGAKARIRGQENFTAHLLWRRGEWVVRAENNQPDYVAARFRPPETKVGDTYTWNNRTYKVIETWLTYDPTQISWFSGQQNRIFYEEMLRVFGEALKTANPEVKLIGGWGFHIYQDDWEAWKQLYKPLVDNFHDLLDGINEHHYGGDTKAVVASYETVTAYSDRAHNKRFQFYNTEAGGMLDPERPENILPRPEGEPLRRAMGAMTYTLRDIIHAIAVAPDKAIARAAHEAHQNGGDEFAFRLLRPLRGQLIYCTSPHADLWCVASRNQDQMTVVLFNDANFERQFQVQIDAPANTNFLRGKQLSVRPKNAQQLELITSNFNATGNNFSHSLNLKSKIATTLTFDLDNNINGDTEVKITQYFAESILMSVSPDKPLSLSVSLPAAELAQADSARLKLVLVDYHSQGTVKINNNSLDLQQGNWTTYQDIDLNLLQPETNLSFQTLDKNYGLWMVSIELINFNS
ncbi:MAG: hypothetical protein SAJ37_21395 [Oscillatoria sp. PMC 1068.18]|nr:hypothetical protein [Oscillatoria sp. PMC 1068.18]